MEKVDAELEWQLLLSFIRETVSICPQTFVSSVCRSSTMPDKEHAFLLWIMSSLFRVLPLLVRKVLHPEIIKCVRSILQLTRQRDHPAFCYLLQEVVSLSSDLAKLECACAVSSQVGFPVYLSHFQYSWTKQFEKEEERDGQEQRPPGEPPPPPDLLHPWIIEVHNPEHVAFVLQASLEILGVFEDDLCQFCPSEMSVVLETLGSSLEYGSTGVKVGALDLVKGLMGRKANINRSTLDHITWCLVALISFVSNAHITDGRR